PAFSTFPLANHAVHRWSWVADLPGQPFLLARLHFNDAAFNVVPTNGGATYFTTIASAHTHDDEYPYPPIDVPQTLLSFVASQATPRRGSRSRTPATGSAT